MKRFFSRYCVKCLTLKKLENAERYLPSVASQLQVLTSMSDEEIQERVWSYDIRLDLLRKGNYALMAEVTTEQEFDIILASGNVETVIKALRHYVPKKEQVWAMLSKYSSEAVKIAEVRPSVFDCCTPRNILGVVTSKWQLADALVAKNSGWACKFMPEIRMIEGEKLTSAMRDRYIQYFGIALGCKSNLASELPYLWENFPEQYGKLREAMASRNSNEFALYFKEAMWHMLIALSKGRVGVYDIETIPRYGEMDESFDGYVWLANAYYNLCDKDVYASMLSSMQSLQKYLSSQLFNQILKKMVENVWTSGHVQALLKFGKYKTSLRAKLIGFADANLEGYFPFEDWEEDQRLGAVTALIEAKRFPCERIAELPERLQKVAEVTLEEQAQIEAVKFDVAAVGYYKLLPKAEAELFAQGEYAEKYCLSYIKNQKLDDATVMQILKYDTLKDCGRSLSLMDSFIFEYAKKWHISKKIYLAILASPMAHKIAYLKEHME